MKRNRLRWGSIALVLMASYWEAPKVSAHGVPALVTSAGDQLAIIGLIPVGEFVDDGFDIYADAPGFGINFSSVGPPAGTELLFETTGELLYWDGAAIVDPLAALTVEAPEFDSRGVPVVTAVDEYLVAADSAPQTGMTWATYQGFDFWHADGYFTLSPGAAAGVYGVPSRLASPTLEASDPFLLTFVFQDGAAWDAADGIAALQSVFNASMPGDFNGDGAVDSADYVSWSNRFGQSVPEGTGSDGNADGVVDAADYTVWRDALAQGASTVSIPEPSAVVIVLVMWVFFLAYDLQLTEKNR